MVVYDDVEAHEKLKIYDKGVKAIRRTDTYGEFQFAYHYGDIVSPYIRFEEPLRVECLHFVECITENKRPLTDGYNGLRVVEIIEAAQRSLQNGGAQEPIGAHKSNGSNGHATAPLSESTLKEYAVAD
jgi:predicted dehydrogenase